MNATLPGFWVMGVVLAWAILWGWAGGLVAAVVVSVADLSVREEFTQQVYGYIFLLVLGGAIVGFLSGLLQQTARERDLAERSAAAAAERERLARVVHDGVLQALALVQRRAPELGAEGVELGQLRRRAGGAVARPLSSRARSTWRRRSATRTWRSGCPPCRPSRCTSPSPARLPPCPPRRRPRSSLRWSRA